MKSKITLYYKSLVRQDRNFILDDGSGESTIETYLASLTKIEINDFQYIKQQLSLSIKINMNQTNLEMVDSKDLNYVKIQNVNDNGTFEKACYYFIIGKQWRSKNTIELVLSMDTLNSNKYNADYIVTSKSTIKRMHKDRFKKGAINNYTLDAFILPELSFTDNDLFYLEDADGYMISCRSDGNQRTIPDDNNSLYFKVSDASDEAKIENGFIPVILITLDNVRVELGDATITTNRNYIRIIDLKSEEINTPLYKHREDILQETNKPIDWALYYKNQTSQDNSPVDCFLVPNQPATFKVPVSSRIIEASSIPDGKILFIVPSYNGELLFDVNGNDYRVYQETKSGAFGSGSITAYCVGIRNNGGQLIFSYYTFSRNIIGSLSTPYTLQYQINPILNAVIEFKGSNDSIMGVMLDDVGTSYEPFPVKDTTINFTPSSTITLNTKNDINKTLEENLKIINLPYCPSDVVYEADGISLPPLWTYDSTLKFLKLTDLNSKFSHTIVTSVVDILNIFETTWSITLDERRTMMDSKLYHSDYYRPKFVYDSFSRNFPLEQIDYEESIKNISSDKFEFTFVMTRNIVSKFLFKFNYVYMHSTEDYPNVVAVARNNEEVLYNSSYLNYIRTGYNYDLKSKERQEGASAIGIGLNFASVLASIGLSFIPGGKAFGVAGAIASGLGLVNQIVNYAKTTAQNEENIQRKLQESQRQAVSVLNADDYDLLYEYTQNKAKLCLYQSSDMMRRVLDDLFYYGGYLVNEQMIPETSSRYWFNYVQASLVIEESSNLNQDIEDDIKEKFEQGVTFLHYHNKFDFEQVMENWEIELL